MLIITIFLSIALSLFSTIVMSYISLATPIGPWIAPTLIFVGLLFSQVIKNISTTYMSYAVCAGSIGGIIATACAFSFPTLFFLDPTTFSLWMHSPLFFCSTLTLLALLAGIFGLLIAEMAENTLLNKQHLAFPIGQLSHKMITAADHIKKAYELVLGFCTTAVFCILQGGPPFIIRIIPQTLTLIPKINAGLITIPHIAVHLDIAPMIWAIGFVTGHVIGLPLAVGAISNIILVQPLHKHFFMTLSSTEFTLALCSGIVLYITATSLVSMPGAIISSIKKNFLHIKQSTNTLNEYIHKQKILACCLLISALFIFFSYFEMPLIAQLYLIACSIITTYQISAIAGRIGLALLGRFATFVMVPAMLLFNLNYVHIVFIATFVEISGGVATDVLFGRKLAQLANISSSTVRTYQLLGLIISSFTIGIVFWLLINHFGLGSPELCAYRAQSRQLLIQAHNFDYIVMAVGALFGFILKYLNLNPMLVLGGLLMPLDITLGLVTGGLLTYCCRNKEEWYPFWSGVFASNSLCMMIRALFIKC